MEEALRRAHGWNVKVDSRFVEEVEESVKECTRPESVLESALNEVYAETFGEDEKLNRVTGPACGRRR
jgi:hypothetical protein